LATGIINVYPNPTHENLFLNIPSLVKQKCSVRMIDAIGKQLIFDTMDLVEGDNFKQYNLNGYANGLYYLVFEREGLPSETVRVVVE
jgi:hypothetical protein